MSRAERNGVERSRRASGVLYSNVSRLFSVAPSRSSFFKSFFSFFLPFLRSFLRSANVRLCLIGVAAFSCVGPLAPRTSSYPDSWDETQRPSCLACVTAATGESVPSNPRVGLRRTSCSYGQDSPDRKGCSEIHYAFQDGNQKLGSIDGW